MTNNEQASDEPKISESTTGIVLALVFFFPLGFYWLWKQPDWTTNKRSKFAISGLLWAVILGASNSSDEDDTQKAENTVVASVDDSVDIANQKLPASATTSDFEQLKADGGDSTSPVVVVSRIPPIVVKRAGGLFSKSASVSIELAPDVSQDIELKEITWGEGSNISFKITVRIVDGRKFKYTVYEDDGAKLGMYTLILPFRYETGETLKTLVNIRDHSDSDKLGARVLIHY